MRVVCVELSTNTTQIFRRLEKTSIGWCDRIKRCRLHRLGRRPYRQAALYSLVCVPRFPIRPDPVVGTLCAMSPTLNFFGTFSLFLCLCLCLSVCSSVYVCACLSVCSSVYVCPCLFFYISACLSVPCVCLSVSCCLSVCPFVRLSVVDVGRCIVAVQVATGGSRAGAVFRSAVMATAYSHNKIFFRFTFTNRAWRPIGLSWRLLPSGWLAGWLVDWLAGWLAG